MKKDANDLVSILVEGSVLEEDTLTVPSSLKISGRVTCNIDCSGRLIIGSAGSVKGNVKAQSLVIHGSLTGSAWVKEYVRLSKQAVVSGYLSSERIEVEDGATCNFRLNVESGAEDRHEKADIRQLVEGRASKSGVHMNTDHTRIDRNGAGTVHSAERVQPAATSAPLPPSSATPAAPEIPEIPASPVNPAIQKDPAAPAKTAASGKTSPTVKPADAVARPERTGARPVEQSTDSEQPVIERFW